ncbi:MAG: hypothetical protein ACJAYU_004132 [Bradymonadia bacterium]|jgi:uncharacterized protein involved in exopolysaccharide biosynthesis
MSNQQADRQRNPLLEITSRIDPRLFIDAVLSRWYVIVLSVLVTTTLALALSLSAPASYSARAIIKIQSNVSLNAILDNGPRADWEYNSQIPVVLEVLNSRPVARAILTELEDISAGDSPEHVDLMVALFHQNLMVFPTAAGIIEIEFKSRDQDVVVRVMRMLMTELRGAMVAPQVESLDASVEFLGIQLERIRSELDAAEAEMRAYTSQSTNQRPEVYAATLEHYAEMLSEYSSAQSERVAAQERLRIGHERLAGFDPTWSSLEERVSRAQSNLNRLSTTYTDNHQEVRSAQSSLDAAQEAMTLYESNPTSFDIADIERILRSQGSLGNEMMREELNAYRTALTEAQAMHSTVELISSQIEDTLESLATFSESATVIANMQQDMEAKSSVYTRLLAQYEEAVVNRSLTVHEEERHIWIIEQPNEEDPPERSQASLKKAGVGGILLGMIMAGFLIVLAEFFGKTVRVPMEAEDKAGGVAVIGTMPPLETT